MQDNVTISSYEFHKRFPDAESARVYLEGRRWNGKPSCPTCSCTDRIQTRKVVGYFRCLACKLDFTVRTGTIFERSHIPLDKWLFAMYLVATARKGISSLQLSKELGVTQKSTWFMLQRIREACGNDDSGPLSGIIEVDETYIGGKETNRRNSEKLKAGRGTAGKTAIVGLRQRGGKVKAKVVKSTSAKTLKGEISNNVSQGSIVCTDDHPSYKGMANFDHKIVNHSAKEYVNGMAHTNSIESVWALLKRGYYGTYHNFSVKHMQRYVDEFSYRLNEGNCKIQTMDRINSLIDKSIGTRITYETLTT